MPKSRLEPYRKQIEDWCKEGYGCMYISKQLNVNYFLVHNFCKNRSIRINLKVRYKSALIEEKAKERYIKELLSKVTLSNMSLLKSIYRYIMSLKDNNRKDKYIDLLLDKREQILSSI